MQAYNQDLNTYLDIQRRKIMNWRMEDEIRFQTSEAVRTGRIIGEQIVLKRGEKCEEKQSQRKEKLKMARNMLQKNFSTNIISEITGLPEQQIKNINRKKKISF